MSCKDKSQISDESYIVPNDGSNTNDQKITSLDTETSVDGLSMELSDEVIKVKGISTIDDLTITQRKPNNFEILITETGSQIIIGKRITDYVILSNTKMLIVGDDVMNSEKRMMTFPVWLLDTAKSDIVLLFHCLGKIIAIDENRIATLDPRKTMYRDFERNGRVENRADIYNISVLELHPFNEVISLDLFSLGYSVYPYPYVEISIEKDEERIKCKYWAEEHESNLYGDSIFIYYNDSYKTEKGPVAE